MKIITNKHLIIVLVLSCHAFFAKSQTDSSWFDLGRIKIKKDFTQTVTIKATALEQMPFFNLTDALGVWLHGLGTNAITVTYVIDGNLLTDPNAYSIHDIEEITLVQNALVQLNGAQKEEQLVLITTKKNIGEKQGLTLAGSSYLVKNSFSAIPGKLGSKTNGYHNYYVSAYQNREKLQYGLSANWHREVFPFQDTGVAISTPFQTNRIRLQGYLNAQPNSRNKILLRAGYVPNKIDWEYLTTATLASQTTESKQTYFNIEAGWQTQIGSHFTNALSAGYVPRDITSFGRFEEPRAGGWQIRNNNSTITGHNWLIRDQLNYHIDAGKWQIDPALSLSFRKIRYDQASLQNAFDETGTVLSASSQTAAADYNIFLATPAINFTYNNMVYAQAGVLYNLADKPNNNLPGRKLFPFITAGADLVKLAQLEVPIQWKLFASFATAGNLADDVSNLSEIGGLSNNYYYPLKRNLVLSSAGNTNIPFVYGYDTANNMMQAGTTLGAFNNKLQFSYSFERRTYGDLSTIGWGTPAIVHVQAIEFVNRLGITTQGKLAGLDWLVGLNASAFKTGMDYKRSDGAPVYTDPRPAITLWTGGFVNRVQFKGILFGFDLLYEYNAYRYTYPIDRREKDRQFSLRHLYTGYRFTPNGKWVELYASIRNPGQGNRNYLPDRRNYFGLGAKTSF